MRSVDRADAGRVCRKRVEAHPDEDSHLLALAWALYDSGETAEATDCFEQLFRRELLRRPFTGFAYDELVRIHRQEKNGKALVSVCERAVSANPDDAGILRTLGEAYLAAGRNAEAIGVFERLAEREPDAPEYRCSLGKAWLAAGDAVRAETEYSRAARIDPDAGPTFFSRLANGLLAAGHAQRARAAWEKCLAARPGDPHSWMGLGDCLVCLGEPEAASDAYGRAADLRPADAGICWDRLGNRLTGNGLHAQAVEAFTKAVASEPGNPLHHLHLAAACAAAGRNDDAAAALQRAEALKPCPGSR